MERRVEPDVPDPQRAEHADTSQTGARVAGEPRPGSPRTIASAITKTPPGLNASDRTRSPCTAATTRARHAAERARDTGGGPQRARERRVHRQETATPRPIAEQTASPARLQTRARRDVA